MPPMTSSLADSQQGKEQQPRIATHLGPCRQRGGCTELHACSLLWCLQGQGLVGEGLQVQHLILQTARATVQTLLGFGQLHQGAHACHRLGNAVVTLTALGWIDLHVVKQAQAVGGGINHRHRGAHFVCHHAQKTLLLFACVAFTLGIGQGSGSALLGSVAGALGIPGLQGHAGVQHQHHRRQQ